MRELVLQHGWKLFVVPVFFDVPDWVKYGCAAIILASLVADVVIYARRTGEERTEARR